MIETFVGGVIAQHVEDKPLFDGLFHRVDVEGPMPRFTVGLNKGRAERFESLVLRRCGESVEVGVGRHAPPAHVLGNGLVNGVFNA